MYPLVVSKLWAPVKGFTTFFDCILSVAWQVKDEKWMKAEKNSLLLLCLFLKTKQLLIIILAFPFGNDILKSKFLQLHPMEHNLETKQLEIM